MPIANKVNRLAKTTLLVVLVGACTGVKSPSPSPLPSALPRPTSTTAATASPSPIPPTETPLPSATPVSDTVDLPAVYGPENFPANVDPLSGIQVNDRSRLERRPLSVKVQIFPRGQRPVWGVSLADIVFDYYQNTGMTRFHAIFYGKDAEQVGPIRSGRLFDSALVRMYKSILAFGGADRRILERFLNSDFSDRLAFEGYGNCPPMCRVDPNGFNFLVANTAELSKWATSKGIPNTRQNLNGMRFDTAVPAGGQAGVQLSVRYSISAYVRWDYDPATGRYLRFQDTQEDTGGGEVYAPMLDGLTNAQIAADNVVVVLLPHSYAFGTQPGLAEVIEIMLDGTGWGYAFRDGQFYQVNWHRLAKDSVLQLSFPDGTIFPLKPGNTWFEVIGQSSRTESASGGVFRFVFSTP